MCNAADMVVDVCLRRGAGLLFVGVGWRLVGGFGLHVLVGDGLAVVVGRRLLVQSCLPLCKGGGRIVRRLGRRRLVHRLVVRAGAGAGAGGSGWRGTNRSPR